MASSQTLSIMAFLFFSTTVLVHVFVCEANIAKRMYIDWPNGESVIYGTGGLQLGLDRGSGSGAVSKETFLFGSYEMHIKLVAGDSAGSVTSFYITSSDDNHDEIDFEFLGNVSGEPYIVHTNLYIEGYGDREQQFYVWFDPAADYHNYTIFWNPNEIVWYIDSIPIRVFRNYNNKGIQYPNQKGMRAHTSIYNADSWATQGGLVKINWDDAPFIAGFRRFRPNCCKYDGPISIEQCSMNSSSNWWNSPIYDQLSYPKLGQLQWVRDTYLVYDYCKDVTRFNWKLQPECSYPQY